jgi:uncharacterized Zn-binding protein involved in type VI secretion
MEEGASVNWLVILLAAVAGMQAQRLPQPTMDIPIIVRGGQAEIDQGHVVQMTPCAPLQGCPVWLAGHRSSHGAIFAQVATLVPGDTVRVLGVDYTVTAKTLVCCSGQPWAPSADLTLQTSATAGQVYLVEASVA